MEIETLATLAHDPAFDTEYLRYVQIEEFCDPIEGLMWGIAANPSDFDLVWPERDIRLAKSDQFQQLGGLKIPRIRILFRIEEDETVCLLDMQYEWEDEEPTFQL